MLRLLSSALLVLLAISGFTCHRDDVAPESASSNLLGEWHWVSSSGGFTSKQTYTPANTSTEQKWVFRPDSTYLN